MMSQAMTQGSFITPIPMTPRQDFPSFPMTPRFISPMTPSFNLDYSGGSANNNGNNSSSKTSLRPKQFFEKCSLFCLPFIAKDALRTRLQVKMIFLVKLIIIRKTKTLIFHSEKNPVKQNTEPVPQRHLWFIFVDLNATYITYI